MERGQSWRVAGGVPGSRELLWIAVVAAAYILAAEAGFALAFATRQVTAVWPPAGIALATFILRGPRIWPGIFLGAFISNALSHEPLYTAAGIALGNTAGPLCGALLLRRFDDFDPALGHLRDVIALTVFGAAAAMLVTASNGVANLVFGGVIPLAAAPSVWWLWWVGDAMGALLVAPAILTAVAAPRRHRHGGRPAELGVAIIALIAASVVFFSSDLPLAYPVFPLVLWIALRFEQREATIAVLIASAVAIWQTVHDRGPFSSGNFDHRLGLLVSFMAMLAVTALALGALAAERRRAEASLREANEALEARVAARTLELAGANAALTSTNAVLERRTAELAKKNEEVEAFVYIVSHDLRAPLVNLQGFSRELELSCGELAATVATIAAPPQTAAVLREIIDDGIGGALRYIGASVSKFERLINALLTLSRTGQQEYRPERLDIQALVAATIDSLHQTIADSAASVTVDALPAGFGDVTAIGQVFANLIGNALKYLQPGRPGQIEIGGKTGDGVVEYWVRDNGAGIPATAHARLFQVFQRFHPELASGEGIGLAAIKRIVERHGGRIRAESVPGAGSCFYFTLPLPENGQPA